MPEERLIDLGEGRSLRAVTAGKGPELLLIHGAVVTGHDWLAGPFDRLVAEGWRVTAIDRPGHGLSRRRRFEGTPRDQARQIREGLDQLGIERPVILSHSYGCLVSLAYAELFPDRVAALVMVAPLAFPEPRLLEHSLFAPRSLPFFGPILSSAAEATIDRPMLKLVQKIMFAPQSVPEEWEASFPYDQTLDPAAMVVEGEDAATMLPMAPAGTVHVGRIRTPAFILTGNVDGVVDRTRQAVRLAALMPDARLIEAQGVGHMLHHARPDLVVDALREAFAPA